MVQIIPANPRKSGWDNVGKALGEFAQSYQHEREKSEKLKGEQKVQKELAGFADRLVESNPNSPVHKTLGEIYKLDIPMDQKTQLAKSLTGMDPFKVEQQKRLQLDSVLKRYNSRLKELDSEITNVKNPNSSGKEETTELRKQRMALRNERDQLLDFRALNGMEDIEESDDFEAEEDEGEEGLGEEEGPKVTFNSNNPKHKAVAQKLFKQHKDKEKVRKILLKKFKGL
jgi:uncharacterized protein YdcH (DUF465 family)